MSINVCKCERNGKVEYHLRYPGWTEAEAQHVASALNSGILSEYEKHEKECIYGAKNPTGKTVNLRLINAGKGLPDVGELVGYQGAADMPQVWEILDIKEVGVRLQPECNYMVAKARALSDRDIVAACCVGKITLQCTDLGLRTVWFDGEVQNDTTQCCHLNATQPEHTN